MSSSILPALRAFLQSHLTLCWGTQSLGDFCKVEPFLSPFSLFRWPTFSTCSLTAPYLNDWSPSPQPKSSFFLSSPRLACPKLFSRVHLLASAVSTGGFWFLIPSENACLQPWTAWRAYLSGTLLSYMWTVCVSCLGMTLQEFSWPDIHTRPWFAAVLILCQFPEKLFVERKGLYVFGRRHALNVLLSGHICRQGGGLSVLARLLPTRNNQHVCIWWHSSASGNMLWVWEKWSDTGVLWGFDEVTLLRTLPHCTMALYEATKFCLSS